MRKINYKTIDEYIDEFPPAVQDKLKLIRKTIKENVPEEAEEVISYQIPCFKLNRKYLIYFAAFKNHVSIYPIPPGPKSFRKEIAPFVKGKGTLQFPNDKELPVGLIEKVTKLSLDANLTRTSKY